jgi:hypothetical protein
MIGDYHIMQQVGEDISVEKELLKIGQRRRRTQQQA